MNGANCGKLIMTPEEAICFRNVVASGCMIDFEEFKSSGEWTKEKPSHA